MRRQHASIVLAVLAAVSIGHGALAAPPVAAGATLVSRSATIPGGGSGPVTVLEIPAGMNYVLTQYCHNADGFGSPELAASRFGVIAAGSTNCTKYEPGIMLQGPQTLTCTLRFPGGDDRACMVTGYAERRR